MKTQIRQQLRCVPVPFLRGLSLAALLGLAAAFPSCGGGGGGGGGPTIENEDRPANVEESLDELGVDTTESPRKGPDGEDLPESYAPLGGCFEPNRQDELMILGLDPIEAGGHISVIKSYLLEDESEERGRSIIHSDDAGWAEEQLDEDAFPQSLRDATGTDLDGDGLQEMVSVLTLGDEIWVQVREDDEEGFSTNEFYISFEPNGVRDLCIIGGMMNDNLKNFIVIGVAQEHSCKLYFARLSDGELKLVNRFTRQFDATLTDAVLNLELATGNLDFDKASELALVINQYAGDFDNPTASSRFYVLDDLDNGLGELRSGFVSGRDQLGAPRTAVVADVSIGDIDGDLRDEVVLGGLTEIDDDQFMIRRFMTGLEWREGALRTIEDSTTYEEVFNDAECGVRFLHINTLDMDGDRVDEIALNNRVHQWDGASWNHVEDYSIPDIAFYPNTIYYPFLDSSTSAIATGEFSNDGREDLAVLVQGFDNRAEGMDTVYVHGLGDLGDDKDKRLEKYSVQTEWTAKPSQPVLVRVNADNDGPILSYSNGEYQLIFTEPVLIAALAAPPCVQNAGQNIDGCYTAFGNTESSSSTEERAISVTASATVGVSAGLGRSGFELKASVTRESNYVTSKSYTVSKTILFTSGALEDSVVLTCVPMDQYTYQVLSHPDPAMLGETVVVSLPREPITLVVEREFYNASVREGELLIDEAVFRHRIGDLDSYLTAAEKDAILSDVGGLEVGPQSVGQGSGETELTLEVAEELSQGQSLAIGYELEMEATHGALLAGASVGMSQEDTLTLSSGQSTTYTGSVGSINSDNFADNRYRFGLFTYVYSDEATGQQFEVLNYWVE